MTDLAQEYIDARRVLLDALDALAPQRASFVLVGAQAIYLRAGAVEGTGIYMTTDSDLAVDADLLGNDPELTSALTAAGFIADAQPGSWIGHMGVKVDVMSVPHQSNRPAGSRAANLPPHGKRLARITPGLEPALIDNSPMLITAFEADDDRSVELRVAGPAALLTAKLIKIRDRQLAVEAGKADRLKIKDVLDCYRLLFVVETDELEAGFESHRANDEALATTREALSFFERERRRGDNGLLRRMLTEALVGDLVAHAAFDALSGDLMDALAADLWPLGD